MAHETSIRDQLQNADLPGAIASTKSAIRNAPTEQSLRFVLFQLLCVAGDWEGARNQLATQAKLAGESSPFLTLMESNLNAEIVREQVFHGKISPAVLGEPPPWIVPLERSLAAAANGAFTEGLEWQVAALDAAAAVTGSCDGSKFARLLDGDSRLGPVLEVIVRGAYRWVPQFRIRSLEFKAPEQPRDLVWAVAQLTLDDTAQLPAFLPVRYPMASTWSDDRLRLGHRTEWFSPVEGYFEGRGQKIWFAGDAEYPALDIRHLEFCLPASP